MQQTLLRIPLDVSWQLGPLTVPGFGFGIVLAAWIAIAAFSLWQLRKELNVSELLVPAVVWLAIAVVIAGLPKFVHRDDDAVIAQTTAVIDAGEGRPAAWLARARAHESKHDYAAAAADLKTLAARGERESGEAQRELAWLLATTPDDSVRDGKASLEAAQNALAATGESAATLDALGAAYAETGDFDGAIAAARRGALLANESAARDASAQVRGLRERLARYEKHQPWREPRTTKAIPVYGYGFMMFLGFLVSGWWAVRRAATVGISRDVIWDIMLWVFFAGVAGSRLFYIAQYPQQVFAGAEGIGKLFAVFNLPDGGLVLYGGVLLGIVAFIVSCRIKKVSAPLLADVLIPSLLLGVGFGRIGCFLNGCCYGDRCDLGWCFPFPAGSVPDVALVTQGFQAADDVVRRISLHPAQLYSALDGVVLAFLTASYFRRRPYDGAVVTLGWLCYPITRFLIEYVRDDEALVSIPLRTLVFFGNEVGRWQSPFTISQWVSIGLFAAGLVFLWWNRRRRARV